MADDRMKNDDLQKNMGSGQKGQDYGQQSPGRSGQKDQQAGQHGGSQQGGQFGGQKGTRMDDDDEDFGASKTGSQNRGGQNR